MKYAKQYFEYRIYKYIPNMTLDKFMELTLDQVEIIYELTTALMDREIAENKVVTDGLKTEVDKIGAQKK